MGLKLNRRGIVILLALSLLLTNFSFLVGSNVAEASNVELTQQQNLLINGSFENIDDEGWASSWHQWVASGNPQYSVDEDVFKEGVRSLKISAAETSRGSVNQGINFTEEQRGKDYKIEQWIQTEEFTGVAYFRVALFDQNGNRIGGLIESDKITQVNDWSLVEMDLHVPEEAVRVNFQSFFENGIGTVWFDDTRFYEYNNELEEENLLTNGSFEVIDDEGWAKSWSTWIASGNLQYGVDETVSKDGLRSMKISADEMSRGTINQRVNFSPAQLEKTYRVEQWMKTEDFTGTAYFRLQIFDQAGNRIGSLIESNKIGQVDDWTLVELEAYIPENAVYVNFQAFFENGTGTVWYDDTHFYEYDAGDTGENLIQNGSFEILDGEGWISPWSTWVASGNLQYTIDETVFKEGSRSVKISADELSRGTINQGIMLTEQQRGKYYRFEQWMKTEDFTGTAYFRIQIFDQAGERIGNLIESNKIFQEDDWTLIELETLIPTNAVRVNFQAFFDNGTGTVWYDDTRFYEYIHVTEIQMDPEEVTLLPGQSVQLNATLIPENVTEQLVYWESSDESVATVDEGMVTAQAEGIAAITVRAKNGVKADSIVIVGEAAGIAVRDYEASVEQGSFVNGEINASSDTGGALTYTKLTDPDHGIAQVMADGEWTYYADQNYTGPDHFFVAIRDETGNYDVSKVALDVLPVALAPELGEVIQPTDKNTPVNGRMSVVQANGETLIFHIEDQPSHGQVDMNSTNGHWTYTPDPDYVGKDSFTVRVENEHGKQASTLVRLYTAPTAEEIVDELKQNNPNHQHPRLMATADDFARIRSLIENQDEKMVKWFERIKTEADTLLTLPPVGYAKPDGLGIDTSSSNRVKTLAFVYQITRDPVYAERAWEEMEVVTSEAYLDWSPNHYLRTAAMTEGIAIGYDWLYNYLTEEQRAFVRQGIIEKGLSPAIPMYLDKTANWVTMRNNWSFVTNAGMTMGALAIGDEEEEIAGLILREAFKSIQYGLTQYAPDGSTYEGPGYWEYGTLSLIYFLSSLETSMGHDYDFSDREGIAETPLYPIHIAGPNGSFNHSDNNDSLIPGRLLLWFAERYNKPEYTWYHQFVDGRTAQPGLYDMLWYRPETYGAQEPSQLDQHFVLPKAVTMRSTWSDPNALFVGFKGGLNGPPHGELDAGTFVFDAYGVRWALDLGLEDYNLPGYWDYNGPRWNYYRKITEGHNTLVIEPSSTWPYQEVGSVSEIVQTEFERPEGSFAIADLTPAYKTTAASVKRGTALTNFRREFLVQDEIKLMEPSELFWFMHTRAQIEINEDGKIAWLSQGGRQLAVQLITPAEASFSVMDAEPLPSSPNPSGQTPNFGIKKLTIHLEDQLETTIAVRMIPILPGETANLDLPAVVPLDEWMIETGHLAQLERISINGEPAADFHPDRYVYDVEVPLDQEDIPIVTAQAPEDYDVMIEQATQLPGTTKIIVIDPSGSDQSAVYYIVFQTPSLNEIPDDAEALIPIAVTASTHDGNVPENTLDGNLNTRWSAEGEQWIEYKLGEVKDLLAVAIAWYQGNVRQSYFELQLSEDGEQWQTVHEGYSAGETADLELTIFKETPAKYVRILGYGNTRNQWNSIAEVMIYGKSKGEEPTQPVTTASLLDLVDSLAEDGAFTNEQAVRALNMHLTALQVFEQQEDAEKIVQHLGGLQLLLDHQKQQDWISEQAYNDIQAGADALLGLWK